LKIPSTRKKIHANKPRLEAALTEDDINMVRRAMEDDFEDILQRYGEKQEEIYGRIERELKEVHQEIHLSHTVHTVPSSSQIVELGDELSQLRRLVDATKAQLQRV
jgi:polyhydroxyalkanoate synthesis regulator phasin